MSRSLQPPASVPELASAIAMARPSRVAPMVGSLAAVYMIWSSTYLAIGIAVAELPPLGLAALRFLAGGAIMLAFARHRGAAWPTREMWLRALPVGLLLFLCGNGFVAVAEQSVPSGGAAVVCATMPLWVAALGALFGERPSRREWLALVIGFAGVVVLAGGPSLAGEPAHIALAILSPIAWAAGSLLARRIPKPTVPTRGDAFASVGAQMLTGGGVLAIASVVRGEPLPIHASAAAWGALAYLLVFGSLIGFSAYSWLLQNARPAVATSYAFVNPALAVVLGAIRGEPFGWTTGVAIAAILGAVVLVLRKPRS